MSTIKTLRIGEIDYNKELPKVDLFLCRPDGTTISKITEAHDVSYTTKINIVNQLSFKIPVKIEKDRAFIHNPHIDMLKPRYIVKMIKNHVTEYFLLTEQSKEASSSGKYIQYSVFGLGYELINQNIRRATFESKTPREMIDDLLSSTLWRIDYIDDEIEMKRRSFEITSSTILQSIYDLAKFFNVIIKWNTIKRTISLYAPERLGKNMGLRFKEGKYLDSASIKIDSTETITRLEPYGKDNLTIAEAVSTGVPYLESFYWYVYPFQQDDNGKVIKSSHYFSDDLCIALIDYDKLLKSKEGEFQKLLSEIQAIEELLSNSDATLNEIKTKLKIAWDKIDVSNASIGIDKNLDVESLPPEHWDLIREKDRLEELLYQQNLVHTNYETQKEALINKQLALKELLKRENNFTPSQIKQLVQFTITREYVNDSIEEAKDLLEDAEKVFADISKPKITAKISIVNFLESIESQHDWNKLNLGDIVYIFEKDLEVEIQAKITEITYNFENKDIQLLIENETEKSETAMDKIKQGANGSAIIGHDKWDWNLSKENNGKINDIINNKWDAEKNAIEAGYEQLIEISERGIIVTSPDEECKSVIIQAGRIALTQDCGNTWKTAINPDGIWAEHLWGKVISGVNLIIEDESGVWMTQGSRTTIYDRTYKEVMRLGLVSDEGERECFGLKSWNSVTQVELTDCLGFAISKWNPDKEDWKKVLWASPDGTIMSKHMIAEGIQIVNDIGDVILDAEANYLDIGALEKIFADLVISPIEKLELSKTMSQMHENFTTAYLQAQDHYFSSRDITYDFEQAFDKQKGSFPVLKHPHESVPTDVYLHEFSDLSISYQRVLDLFYKYLSYKKPTIKPSSNHNIIDNIGFVASDFLPENLIFEFGTELMHSNSELIELERKNLTATLQDFYTKLKLFNKKLTDMVFYSGLQMGKFYNNVIVDNHGFIAVRNDGKYRAYLNATHGLALQKWEKGKWVSKLYATLGHPDWEDGTLYAEGLVTKNLRIVDGDLGEKITFDHKDGITIYGNNGEIIKLNANEAISIYTNGDKKFWVGTDGRLYAKDITTHGLKIVDGQLGEKIIFDHNDGITINGNNREQIRLNANEGIAIDVKGEKRVWIGNDGLIYAKKLYIMGEDEDEVIEDIDGSYISELTVNKLKTLGHEITTQDIIHVEKNFIHLNTWYSNQEKTKMKITFDGTGDASYPLMEMGAGISSASWGNGTEKARIYKDSDKFAIEYDSPTNKGLTKFHLNDTDTDDEKQAVYLQSGGGIRLESDNKVVLKVAEEQHLRLIKGEENKISFGDSAIQMTKDSLILKFGTSIIKLDSSGVKINGQRIDLN